MRRVIINIGCYDIVYTTELVFLGSDPRCVEDLGDAFLQAGAWSTESLMVHSSSIRRFSTLNWRASRPATILPWS